MVSGHCLFRPSAHLRSPWEGHPVIHPPTKSVLLVDDDPFVRRALRQVFSFEADFHVCGEAENGREAIEKAEELQPDLIVIDLSMPVMNGFDAARLLQRSMPSVPIIMFSEYSDAFAQKEARSAGIAALISKSQNATTLVTKARDLLRYAAA
jgi:DNA-binding NarL/FixJ family response regulator